MGERSIPWSGLKSGAGGPDAGPYSDENWSDIWRKLFTTDRTTEGVIAGYEDELEVSGTSTPVTVAAGAALVDGNFMKMMLLLLLLRLIQR